MRIAASTFSSRFKLLGGLLFGVAVAGAVFSLAFQEEPSFEEPDEKFSPPNEEPLEECSEPEPEMLGELVLKERDGLSIAVLQADGVKFAGLTHVGKKRANNQDCFRLEQVGEQTLAIVCDGMGGHAGGEIASQIATDMLWNVLSKKECSQARENYENMVEAFERADAAINQRSSKDKDLEGMGTTAVIASIERTSYVHSYLGDSRLYHLRDGAFIYQTLDHSVVRYLIEEGVIQEHEAKDHPYRSQLTSSLGGGPRSNKLTVDPKWDSEESPCRKWISGDWLLLCSDGLNSELEDSEILEVLTQSNCPEEAVIKLKDRVLETPARDNVTLIVAQRVD